MKGQVEFIDEGERRAWSMDFYKLARQKLEMTKRWSPKQGTLRNILLLTPAEQERLISAMNVKVYWARADKNAKTKRSLIAGAKALLEAYNRLLDGFFEGKLREERKRTIDEILHEKR
jgi:hypothetical protein